MHTVREIMQVQELVLNWISGRKKCWQLVTWPTAAAVVLLPEAALRLFRSNPVSGVSKHCWPFGQCLSVYKKTAILSSMVDNVVTDWAVGSGCCYGLITTTAAKWYLCRYMVETLFLIVIIGVTCFVEVILYVLIS
jgi:hypothetical protein